MNALVLVPRPQTTEGDLEAYFKDFDRLGFDVPCIVCRALSARELTDAYFSTFSTFLQMAASRGIPATFGINVYDTNSECVAPSEGQYYFDNRLATLNDGFYASFASEKWREHLREAICLFVRDMGYPWMLLGEPLYAVDIPGSRDRTFEEFHRVFPDLPYPEIREESASYLSLQKLKTDIVTSLVDDLSKHAKSLGVQRVGVLPRPFVPGVERRSPGSEVPLCCDNARLVALPAIDYGLARILPNNIVPEEESDCDLVYMAYDEVLGNASGKATFAVLQAPGETVDPPRLRTSHEQVRKATLAALAGAPAGIGMYWQPETKLFDTEFADLLLTARDVLPRMGGHRSPGAFVFSHSSTWHVDEAVGSPWSHYTSFMRYARLVRKWPTPAYGATALEEMFRFNPDLMSILLEEHFPLTPDQVDMVLRWWREKNGRNIIVVGSGTGLSADPNAPGKRPIDEAFPGLFEEMGLRVLRPCTVQLEAGSKLQLRASSSDLLALAESGFEVDVDACAHVEKRFGSGTKIFYADTDGRPIATCMHEGDRAAYFLGLECNPTTAPLICRLIDHVMAQHKMPMAPVAPVSGDFMWCSTYDGYIIMTNPSDEPARAKLQESPRVFWDVLRQEMMTDKEIDLTIQPGEVRVLRALSRVTKLIDVANGVYVHSMPAGAGRAEVDIETGRPLQFVVKTPPRKLYIDGEEHNHAAAEKLQNFVRLTITGAPQGRHIISMTW